jgi:hypothetical protein
VDAAAFFETLVAAYKLKRRHTLEDHNSKKNHTGAVVFVPERHFPAALLPE